MPFVSQRKKYEYDHQGNRKAVGDYWLGKTLGHGSSGCVKLGIHKVTGEKVAIKIISKSSKPVDKSIKREIAVMKLVQHPNIIRLIDVIDSTHLYLILEYAQGGELFDYLVSKGRLSESEARKYFQQLIMGVDYCHQHLICHRDLKPENLLLDRQKILKIADFGMASLQPSGQQLKTSCGSPHYASPEIIKGIPYDGSASDIWSCGVILYALLCGYLPFDDENIKQLLNKVKIGEYKIPDYVSNEAKDLISKILVIDPTKRLTIKQVQNHAWFTKKISPGLTSAITVEIGRPISSKSSIDLYILDTLNFLWFNLSMDQLVDNLLNSEYNMQKVTYALLEKYANKQHQQTNRDHVNSLVLGSSVYPTKDNKPFLDIKCESSSPKNQASPNHESPTSKRIKKEDPINIIATPEPIVIRAEQLSDTQKPWLFTPLPERKNIWHSPTVQNDIIHFRNTLKHLNTLSPRSQQTSQQKINRFLNMLHKDNRVDQDQYQSPFSLKKPLQQTSPPITPIKYHQQQAPVILKSLFGLIESPIIHRPTHSWFVSFFKQSKIYCLECEAKDESQAIIKISQVLDAYLEGTISEKVDLTGQIKRIGQVNFLYDSKTVILKFKLELYLLEIAKDRRIYKVNFIQQQGDNIAFIAFIKLLDQALKDYEHEARLMATTVCWNRRNSIIS